MPSGRCSGCGHTDSSKKVAAHITTCPAYLDLYLTEPQRCLSPSAEARRHRTADTAQARAQRRDLRLRHRFAELDQQVRTQIDRWRTPPDLLD